MGWVLDFECKHHELDCRSMKSQSSTIATTMKNSFLPKTKVSEKKIDQSILRWVSVRRDDSTRKRLKHVNVNKGNGANTIAQHGTPTVNTVDCVVKNIVNEEDRVSQRKPVNAANWLLTPKKVGKQQPLKRSMCVGSKRKSN